MAYQGRGKESSMANHLEAGQEEPFNTDYAYRQGRLHYEITFKGHNFNYFFFHRNPCCSIKSNHIGNPSCNKRQRTTKDPNTPALRQRVKIQIQKTPKKRNTSQKLKKKLESLIHGDSK